MKTHIRLTTDLWQYLLSLLPAKLTSLTAHLEIMEGQQVWLSQMVTPLFTSGRIPVLSRISEHRTMVAVGIPYKTPTIPIASSSHRSLRHRVNCNSPVPQRY